MAALALDIKALASGAGPWSRERTIIRSGIVSEPILGVSYQIVSATVVSADITCITAGSSTVDRSHYT